jgi:hypothetical protein
MSTPRKPQDHKRKPQDGDFTFTFREHTVTIPSLNSLLTFGFKRTHRHLSIDEQIYLLLEQNADEDTLATLDLMRLDEEQEFVEQWQEHSGIDTGESKAS